MLYHGPVRAPTDAKAGPAIVRVRMAKDSVFASSTTDIPVTIK